MSEPGISRNPSHTARVAVLVDVRRNVRWYWCVKSPPGCDYSAKREIFAVDQTQDGLNTVLIQLSEVQPASVVMDATCGLEQIAMLAPLDAGVPVSVLNPGRSGISAGLWENGP